MTDDPYDYIAEAITAHWGERCPDYEPRCACCAAWVQYDALKTPPPLYPSTVYSALSFCDKEGSKSSSVPSATRSLSRKISTVSPEPSSSLVTGLSRTRVTPTKKTNSAVAHKGACTKTDKGAALPATDKAMAPPKANIRQEKA